jgi:YVTN family beta-propeller protein
MTTMCTPGPATPPLRRAHLAIPTLLLALTACAGRTEPVPAPAPAAAAEVPTLHRVLRPDVALELSMNPLDGQRARLAGTLVERQDVQLRLALTNPETGMPLRNVRPIAWIDRRTSAEPTPLEQCRQKVGMYLQGKLYPAHAVKAHADVDLNSFYIIALTQGHHIAVIDPILSFSRTQMYTTVPLDSRGEDWVLDRGQRWLYVTMPAVDRVAVVNTDTWRIAHRLEVGVTPTRLLLHPDGRLLWVTTEPAGGMGGLTVIEVATHAVRGRIETGEGPHALTLSPDGRRLFVANAGSGTVSVIDAERLEKLGDVPTGSRPIELAISPMDGMLYIAHEGDGTLAVLDVQTLTVVKRHQLEPGLRTIRFPQPSPPAHPAADLAAHAEHADHDGHADHDEHAEPHEHAGHLHAAEREMEAHAHGPAVRGAERYGYALNPRTNRLYVIDVAAGAVIRSDSVGDGPDQITFTPGYAYIRSMRSSQIAIIPLANPLEGGSGLNFSFPAGQVAPADGGMPAAAAALTTTMGMHEAVLVPNPKERRIYQYHYMPNMMMPMMDGSFSTFAFEPRAVLTVRRGLHEVEPGIYSATIRLPAEGDYDLVFLLDDPRVMSCLDGITAVADPALHAGRVAPQFELSGTERRLETGANEVVFRLKDRLTGKPLAAVEDLIVVVAAPGIRQVRAPARPQEDGLYRATVDVPSAPVYYLTVRAASLSVPLSESPVVMMRGTAMLPDQ